MSDLNGAKARAAELAAEKHFFYQANGGTRIGRIRAIGLNFVVSWAPCCISAKS